MSKICGLLSNGASLLHNEKALSGLDYLSRVDGEEGTWYYWLSSVCGVYELKLKEVCNLDNCEICKVDIRYYPDIDEDAFEQFSFKEQFIRVSSIFDDSEIIVPKNPDVCPCCGGSIQDKKHVHHHCCTQNIVRKKGIPKLMLRKHLSSETFVIGNIDFIFKEDLDKMKVVSQNIYKEYIEEGIQVSDNDGKLVEVVPPGGLDREVLGLDLVDKFMKFFISKFLNAMSINCTLREKRVLPGESKHFFGNKQLKSESDENVKLLIMTYICGKEAE